MILLSLQISQLRSLLNLVVKRFVLYGCVEVSDFSIYELLAISSHLILLLYRTITSHITLALCST